MDDGIPVTSVVDPSEKKGKVMVFGGSGLLGRQLVQNLPNAGYEVLAPKHDEIDITDILPVIEYVTWHLPDVIINCAAYTDVDGCEHNRALAEAVNSEGARNIAFSAAENDIRLIHISTDYVFSSDDKDRVFLENDRKCPCNVYGETKADGEDKVLFELPEASIVRTAWLYGPGGPSFVHSIVKRLANAQNFESIDVVEDQFGCPTPTMLVVDAILHLLKHPEASGIFHAVARGYTSRYQFASEVSRLLRVYHRDLPLLGVVRSCRSDKFISDAKRPVSSILDSENFEKIGYRRFGWESALRMFLLREWDNRDIFPNGVVDETFGKILKVANEMSFDTGPVIDVVDIQDPALLKSNDNKEGDQT